MRYNFQQLDILYKVICAILFTLLLNYIYIYQIQPEFSYMGFGINKNIDNLYFVIITFFISTPILFSPRYIYYPSSIFSFTIYFLVYIPSVSISYISGSVIGYEHIILLFTMFFSICIIMILPRIMNFNVKTYELNNRNFKIVLIFIFSVCSAVLFKYYQPNISNLIGLQSISNLYDIRGDFREIASNVPTIARYIFAWTSKIIVPLILIYGLAKNKKIAIYASLITALLLFSSTGLKSIFMGPIVTYAFWWFLKRGNLTFSTLSLLMVLLLALSTLLALFGYSFLNTLLIRRVLIIPGILTGYYFDFFSSHELTMLGQSIFSAFVDYPYDATPPFVIGEHYFGRSDMSANANFLASAFGDFGWFGCIAFSIIASFFYGLLNRIALSKYAVAQISAVIFLPTWALVDSAFLTSLLTHGLLIVVIIVLILPKSLFR